MQVAFGCPRCEYANRVEMTQAGDRLSCGQCGWSRPALDDDIRNGSPARCLACGCGDLWRQKDFPPQLGLTLVGLGALLSTIAWYYYQPVLAIGILMFFALGDFLLYALMRDVLVCYRCETRYRQTNPDEEHPRFNLETAERYRQEAHRMEERVLKDQASGVGRR